MEAGTGFTSSSEFRNYVYSTSKQNDIEKST